MPTGEGGWFKDISRSGGILLDLAIHDFDWLRWTLGEVTLVFANSVGHTKPGYPGDYALTTLSFENGAVGHVEATWMEPGPSRVTFEVCGSEGMFEYDNRINPVLRTTNDSGSFTESPLLPADDPYYNQLRSFVDAVTNNTTPPVSALDGLAAVAIARAAIESAETGRPIKPARHV